MRSSISVLAPLVALTLASPIVKRTALATSYTLTGFQTFTANVGSTPGNSSVHFSIGDNLGNSASCEYLTPSAATSAANAAQFRACDNPNFSFVWDGSALTVVEFYAVSGSNFLAATSFTRPSLLCYTIANEPFGSGKVCESLTGQLGGEFAALNIS